MAGTRRVGITAADAKCRSEKSWRNSRAFCRRLRQAKVERGRLLGCRRRFRVDGVVEHELAIMVRLRRAVSREMNGERSAPGSTAPYNWAAQNCLVNVTIGKEESHCFCSAMRTQRPAPGTRGVLKNRCEFSCSRLAPPRRSSRDVGRRDASPRGTSPHVHGLERPCYGRGSSASTGTMDQESRTNWRRSASASGGLSFGSRAN